MDAGGTSIPSPSVPQWVLGRLERTHWGPCEATGCEVFEDQPLQHPAAPGCRAAKGFPRRINGVLIAGRSAPGGMSLAGCREARRWRPQRCFRALWLVGRARAIRIKSLLIRAQCLFDHVEGPEAMAHVCRNCSVCSSVRFADSAVHSGMEAPSPRGSSIRGVEAEGEAASAMPFGPRASRPRSESQPRTPWDRHGAEAGSLPVGGAAWKLRPVWEARQL